MSAYRYPLFFPPYSLFLLVSKVHIKYLSRSALKTVIVIREGTVIPDPQLRIQLITWDT